MPSIELSKLQAISSVRALSESDRARSEQAPASRAEASKASAARPGVAIEIGARIDAAQPPVDSDRVAEIRDALRDGTYPLVPTRIADAMIAARVAFTLEK